LKEERSLVRKLLNLVIAASVLMGGLWIVAQPSYGTLEYAKKEKKGCIYCHVTAKEKELNDTGKYYQEHEHSFKGYEPPKKK
jgi:hypothetical protein